MKHNEAQSGFWNDRPTFVTGATGQIGGWLVKRLISAGADIICLIRDWVPQCELVTAGLIQHVKVIRGDVRDYELLRRVLSEYEIDTVIHLAAQSIVSTANKDPLTTFDANIRGTWSLMEACRMIPSTKQIVVASTDKAYGEQTFLPYREEMSLQAVYPHDVSKACADMITKSYAVTYGLNTAITRLPNIFGGGDLNWNRIVPGTIRSIIRNHAPVIKSDGGHKRDYLYVEDAAAAHMHLAVCLASNPEIRGQVFNISNETCLTVLDLVQRILFLMKSDLQPVLQKAQLLEIREQYMSAAKARTQLNWNPIYSFDDGLRSTIDWYQDFFISHGKE
jgi:CDP-glucose 4,6-dehydratase